MISTTTLIKILSIKGIGRKTVRSIIDHIPAEILTGDDLLTFLPQLNPKFNRENILEGINTAISIVFEARRKGISFIDLNSEQYPALLKQIDDPPFVISYKGDINLLQTNCITIVGAREGTIKGFTSSFKYGKLLAEQGYTIVSGLAKGCDKFAHEGCLEAHGNTIAVLANPLNYVYPRAHSYLADQIVSKEGLIISESLLGVKLNSGAFIQRNRIQVGLSKCIIVCESGDSGGTMKTIEFCIKNNRNVGYIVNQNERAQFSDLIKSAKVQPLYSRNDVLSFAESSKPNTNL